VSRVAGWLRSEWLAVRVQIALGAIFVAAALPKIVEPPVFAKNVHAYAVVPGALVNVQALFMPGVEVVAGLALVLGVWRRPAALLCGLLLVLFTAALGYNVVIGNPVSCSCFDLHAAVKSCGEQLRSMKWLLVRDVGMLAMAAHVLWASRREGRWP
jgi:uncharacterized membrane protein YkgB